MNCNTLDTIFIRMEGAIKDIVCAVDCHQSPYYVIIILNARKSAVFNNNVSVTCKKKKNRFAQEYQQYMKTMKLLGVDE